jgi:hypothetical protein
VVVVSSGNVVVVGSGTVVVVVIVVVAVVGVVGTGVVGALDGAEGDVVALTDGDPGAPELPGGLSATTVVVVEVARGGVVDAPGTGAWVTCDGKTTGWVGVAAELGSNPATHPTATATMRPVPRPTAAMPNPVRAFDTHPDLVRVVFDFLGRRGGRCGGDGSDPARCSASLLANDFGSSGLPPGSNG